MWQSRQWRLLLLLIDHLPRNSAYMEALSLDEEFAEEVLRQQEREKGKPQQRSSAQRISEWSPEVELLAAIFDRLGEQMTAIVSSAGGKPPKVRPLPRPRTAMDRLKERRRYEHHKKVVSRVLIQEADGTTKPVAARPAPRPVAPARPALLPGEDPFRMTTRRKVPVPTDGPVTGEPLPPR